MAHKETKNPLLRLDPVTDGDEIAKAFDELSNVLANGAESRSHAVRWRPSGSIQSVDWRPTAPMWTFTKCNATKKQHYVFIGYSMKNRNIDIQACIPRSGFTLQSGGILLKNKQGQTYLCHTGLMGGGAKGVNKQGFLRTYGGQLAIFRHPTSRKNIQVACIGLVNDSALPAMLRLFLDDVLEYKSRNRKKPTTPSKTRLTITQGIEELPAQERERVRREVKSLIRNAQLRGRVIALWGPKCAACGLVISDGPEDFECEVAHVHEVRLGGRDLIANALPLCRTHHWAFDRQLWGIEPGSLRIVVKEEAKSIPLLRAIDGTVVTRPACHGLTPLHDNHLRQRWHVFQKK